MGTVPCTRSSHMFLKSLTSALRILLYTQSALGPQHAGTDTKLYYYTVDIYALVGDIYRLNMGGGC